MSIATHRFVTLDGMRGVAALAVMASHLTRHTSEGIFTGAGLSVDLFFCLSGFVIAHSYLDRLQQSMSVGDFVVRRLVRLYPMFFCGLVLGSIALIAKVAMGQTSLSYSEACMAIVANALYLPYWSDFFYVEVGRDRILATVFPSNDPSWSLFFELVANLLFAALAFQARKPRFLALCLFGMFGLILWVTIFDSAAPGWSTYNLIGGLPRVIFGFFSGVLVYLFFRKHRASIPVVRPTFLMALLVALFVTEWSPPIWLAQTLLVVPPVVLLGAASMTDNAAEVRNNEYLGWISYPVYCLHFPIYSLFTSATRNVDHGMLALAICAPITILLSHVLTKNFEEPARALLSSRLLAKRQRASVESV